MKRPVAIALAALAAFLVILIARFPATWAAAIALPDEVSCQVISGSVWSGSCMGLSAYGSPVGDVGWALRPSRLFVGKIGLRLALTRASASAQGDVDIGFSGAWSAKNVQARLPLDPNLVPLVPPGLRGTVTANLASLRLEGRAVTGIEGQVDLRGLEQRPGTPLGDYRVTFPPTPAGQEPVGRLTDLDGPLSVTGTVRLTREPGYVIDGLVAPKAGAPESIKRQLAILGRPDAQGRRPFSQAGTY